MASAPEKPEERESQENPGRGTDSPSEPQEGFFQAYAKLLVQRVV